MSAATARRIALAAQGLNRRPRRSARPDDVVSAVARLGLVQIDSVNVLCRAHYLPLFSRLGRYERSWLDDAASQHPRSLFEYWGHEASLLPVQAHPLLRWRMDRAADDAWGGMRRIAAERPDLVSAVLQAVAAEGPITAAELERHHGKDVPGGEHWGWRWSEVKRACEYLFWSGQVSAAGRGPGFERRYDLPDRVLPASVLSTPTPSRPDAIRALVAQAARAHGIATESDLRDYYRLPADDCRTAVGELVESGELQQVQVATWSRTAYLHRDASVPQRVSGRALLAPFDPLVWTRARVQRLFDVSYRIEIYVPAAKRVHGYYVLPFLLRDRLVARVDLKADRQQGTLRVRSAWLEPGAPDDSAGQLAEALVELGQWLGQGSVRVERHGDLADDLGRHLPC